MRKLVTILLIVAACAAVLAFVFNGVANRSELSNKMAGVRAGKKSEPEEPITDTDNGSEEKN